MAKNNNHFKMSSQSNRLSRESAVRESGSGTTTRKASSSGGTVVRVGNNNIHTYDRKDIKTL